MFHKGDISKQLFRGAMMKNQKIEKINTTSNDIVESDLKRIKK